MADVGRLLPVGSELASVGLPIHCSHGQRNDCNLPDSGRSIGGALDGSTSQIGQFRPLALVMKVPAASATASANS
jgi:hypothetical protein